MEYELDPDIKAIITRLSAEEEFHRKMCYCYRCNRKFPTKKKDMNPKLCYYCKSDKWDRPRKFETIAYLFNLTK